MKAIFFAILLSFSTYFFAQNPEKILSKAIPVAEFVEAELPTFPGYKSNNRGTMIPATEDAVRGYFIRKLNMRAGNFDKRTIIKLIIKFVVGPEGEVTVTAMESEFDAYIKEGAYVATTLLPKMTPGTYKGKPASVLYNFPLIFIAKPTFKVAAANTSSPSRLIDDSLNKKELPSKNTEDSLVEKRF